MPQGLDLSAQSGPPGTPFSWSAWDTILTSIENMFDLFLCTSTMHLEGLKSIEWRFGFSSREWYYEGTNIQPLTMLVTWYKGL